MEENYARIVEGPYVRALSYDYLDFSFVPRPQHLGYSRHSVFGLCDLQGIFILK